MDWITSVAMLASLIFPTHAEIANYLIMEAHRENITTIPYIMVVWKESALNPKAYNPRDIDGKQKFGLLQYDTNTWKYLTKKMKMPELSINNWKHQVQVFSWAIKNGEGWRWPTIKKSMKEIEEMNIEGI